MLYIYKILFIFKFKNLTIILIMIHKNYILMKIVKLIIMKINKIVMKSIVYNLKIQ